jgi:hypothetical protein
MIENTIEEYKREVEEKLKVFQTDKFLFEEEAHVYTYDSIKYDSVTTFLKIFKEPFKKDYWNQEQQPQVFKSSRTHKENLEIVKQTDNEKREK